MKPIVYVGPNMYRGLEEYCDKGGNPTVDFRRAREFYNFSGLVILCRQCGNRGMFLINYNPKMDIVSKKLRNILEGVCKVKIVIKVIDGNLHLSYCPGANWLDLEEFCQIAWEEEGMWPGEFFECAVCDSSSIEIVNVEMGIEPETVESYGDLHTTCDQPTELMTIDDGTVQEIVSREGVIEMCCDCYNSNFFDECVEYVESSAMNSPFSICSSEGEDCGISQSFYLFNITPAEIVRVKQQRAKGALNE